MEITQIAHTNAISCVYLSRLYLVVHKDAPVTVHKSHPVELTHAETWFKRLQGPQIKNVAVIQGKGGWLSYVPDFRNPDDAGNKVAVAVKYFEDTIFKDKPDAGKIKLKAYKINGNKYHAIVSWDDGKNHYVDFITDSEGKIIPLRLDKILLQHHRNP